MNKQWKVVLALIGSLGIMQGSTYAMTIQATTQEEWNGIEEFYAMGVAPSGFQGNRVLVEGAEAIHINASVSGNAWVNDSKGVAIEDNVVSLRNVTIGGEHYSRAITGGIGSGESMVRNNRVEIEKGENIALAQGAIAENGDAIGNTLSIKDSTGHRLLTSFYGAQVQGTGNAIENTMYLNNFSVTMGLNGTFIGGLAGGDASTMTSGSALGNKVYLLSSTIGVEQESGAIISIIGGQASYQDVVNNEVTIYHTQINGAHVYGGYAYPSGYSWGNDGMELYAKGNVVSIVDATIEQSTITGGHSLNGTSEANRVHVTGSEVSAPLYGGYVEAKGNAYGNEVMVTDSTVIGNIIGGYTEDGDAKNNTVYIEGRQEADTGSIIVGGRTGSGIADHNVVYIKNNQGNSVNGGLVKADDASDVELVSHNQVILDSSQYTTVIGGQMTGVSGSGKIQYNEVSLHDAAVDRVYGGYSLGSGLVSHNYVEITGDSHTTFAIGGQSTGDVKGNMVAIKGGTVTNVAGGYVDGTATVEGNKVLLAGGTVTGKVYGGRGNGTSTGNQIFLQGTANVERATLIGASGQTVKDNALIIDSWSGHIGAVENVDRWELHGLNVGEEPAITIGSISSLENAAISFDFAGGQKFTKGDNLALVQVQQPNVWEAGVKKDFVTQAGVAQLVSGQYEQNQAGLTVTIQDTAVHPQTKTLHTAQTGALVFVQQGTEELWKGFNGKAESDGSYTFASTSGSKMNYDVAQGLKINGWNTVVGLGKEHVKDSYHFRWGAFFENGDASLRTFQGADGNWFRGDGTNVYNGGGLAGRYERKDGWYVEGAVRAGNVKQDLFQVLHQGTQGYDVSTDSAYYGFSIGIGKAQKISESTRVHTYIRYDQTHMEGDRFTIAQDTFTLDSINAKRIRLGARMDKEYSSQWTGYYGVAYEYAMDEASRFNVGTLSSEQDGLTGSIYLGEIGLQYRPSFHSPWNMEVTVMGYGGERKGWMGSIQAQYQF